MCDAAGVPMARAAVSPTYRRWVFYNLPSDYDADTHDFYEYFRLPLPDGGLTASRGYDILTSKQGVTVAQGGTGAGTAAGARANLGIQSGSIPMDQNQINAGSTLDIPVTFPTAFSAAPDVVVGFQSDSTASAFGACACAVLSVSATGFTIRAFNDGSSSRNPGYRWIAVGRP